MKIKYASRGNNQAEKELSDIKVRKSAFCFRVFGDRGNIVKGRAEQVQQKRPLSNPVSSFITKYKSLSPL